jgi:hypothetical protein
MFVPKVLVSTYSTGDLGVRAEQAAALANRAYRRRMRWSNVVSRGVAAGERHFLGPCGGCVARMRGLDSGRDASINDEDVT